MYHIDPVTDADRAIDADKAQVFYDSLQAKLQARKAKRQQAAIDQATDEMLSDVDHVADWLYGACMGVSRVDVDSTVASLKRFKAVEDFDTPTLFALVMSADPLTRAKAGWALRERYLAQHAAILKTTANAILAHGDSV
jgi:hypothetical protein